jgi:hypothetical protein
MKFPLHLQCVIRKKPETLTTFRIMTQEVIARDYELKYGILRQVVSAILSSAIAIKHDEK